MERIKALKAAAHVCLWGGFSLSCFVWIIVVLAFAGVPGNYLRCFYDPLRNITRVGEGAGLDGRMPGSRGLLKLPPPPIFFGGPITEISW